MCGADIRLSNTQFCAFFWPSESYLLMQVRSGADPLIPDAALAQNPSIQSAAFPKGCSIRDERFGLEHPSMVFAVTHAV